MTEREQTDDDLVRALGNGDESAFVTLYRRWQGSVYRFALGMSGSREVAEDVTQDTFMILIREGHRFDPAKGALGTYLRGIARHIVLRKLRRERRYVVLADADQVVRADSADAAPDADLARREEIRLVREAVLRLPVHYRAAVILCDLEGSSYSEVAEILGIPIGTVRSRLSRAREMLAKRLVRPHEHCPVWKRALPRLSL